jgi:hypothetical protein
LYESLFASTELPVIGSSPLFTALLKVLWSEGVKLRNEDNRLYGRRGAEDALRGLDPFLPPLPIPDWRDVKSRSRKIVGNH